MHAHLFKIYFDDPELNKVEITLTKYTVFPWKLQLDCLMPCSIDIQYLNGIRYLLVCSPKKIAVQRVSFSR